MKSYAGVLKRWLAGKGMSPGQAAPLLGVSESTAYEHAAGRSVPPASRVPQLARVLGVDAERLRQVVARERKARSHRPQQSIDVAEAQAAVINTEAGVP